MSIKLKPKQIHVADSLIAGKSCKEAAKSAGITQETISNWKKNEPHFEAYINYMLYERLEATRDSMRNLGTDAVQTLQDILQSGKSESARIKAVEVVLHHIGLTDPQTGHWGWGIGPTTAEEIEHEQKVKENPMLNRLLGDYI